MEKEKIDRINHLARKHRSEGLTEEEKLEQQQLRDEYRAMFRSNMERQLDRVYYKMPDGSTVKAVKNMEDKK